MQNKTACLEGCTSVNITFDRSEQASEEENREKRARDRDRKMEAIRNKYTIIEHLNDRYQ